MPASRAVHQIKKKLQHIAGYFKVYDLLDIRARLRDGDAISRTFQDVQYDIYARTQSIYRKKYVNSPNLSLLQHQCLTNTKYIIFNTITINKMFKQQQITLY